MEDYYAALDLPRDATTERIDEKVRQEVRTWQKRTTNPDLARRQEAERRLRLVAEARKVLLDPQRRAAYDADLAAGQRAPEPPPAPGEDWVGNARRFLASGDYASALYAAKEARNASPRSAEVWSLLGRANLGLGNLRDALSHARRAADIEPRNAGYYFDQGVIYEELEQYDDARRSYEVATKLDPDDHGARYALASVMAQGEKPERALPLLEDLYATGRDKEAAGALLGGCLVRVAEAVPRKRSGDGFDITAADEVDAMERLLFRAREVTRDAEVVADVDRLTGVVRWARNRHLRKVGNATGCAVAVAGGVALLGLIVLAIPVGSAIVRGVFTLVCLAAAGGFFWWAFAPGWVINRDEANRSGTR
ncbi:MAG: tetratricopeptide repeat protein [Acidothermales bacterium]|nr:tetratricopeptide repeat protein [Acidothermales bacterium]